MIPIDLGAGVLADAFARGLAWGATVGGALVGFLLAVLALLALFSLSNGVGWLVRHALVHHYVCEQQGWDHDDPADSPEPDPSPGRAVPVPATAVDVDKLLDQVRKGS